MGPRVIVALCWSLAVAGCVENDIGKACPELLGEDAGAQADGTRSITQEVVAQDLSFPCDEMICIATAGRPGYCSVKCRDDAGCPSGFVCREIQPIGEFAGEKFCAWKPCTAASGCGKEGDFCCREVVGSDAGQNLSFCAFSNDGKCE